MIDNKEYTQTAVLKISPHLRICFRGIMAKHTSSSSSGLRRFTFDMVWKHICLSLLLISCALAFDNSRSNEACVVNDARSILEGRMYAHLGKRRKVFDINRKSTPNVEDVPDSSVRKRALDPEIDLNRTPPREDGNEEDLLVHFTSTAATASLPDSTGTDQAEKQRKENNTIRKRIERQRRRQKIREAQQDPTLMTPELSQSIERSKLLKKLERQRRKERIKEAQSDPTKMTPSMKRMIENIKERNRRSAYKFHHSRMEKLRSGQPLTPKEQKYIQSHNRSIEWRQENKEEHERYLKQRRDRWHAKKVKKHNVQ